jgi:DNA-binding winged helix-turn-helix (wHTH) protein
LIYIFEEYSLDSTRRQLRRGSNVVSVEPQVFEILELLIRAQPNIVSKDELIATIWDGRIVSNSTINSRISAARAAIRDNGKEQRLIQTFSRRGFRFVSVVRIEQGSAHPSAESSEHQFNKSSIAVLRFANVPEDDRKHDARRGTDGPAQLWARVREPPPPSGGALFSLGINLGPERQSACPR